MTGTELFESVTERCTALALAKDRRLVRRRITGADWSEIKVLAETDTAVLKRLGCTVEIVSWWTCRTRKYATLPRRS